MDYTIKKIATLSGVSTRTLRYYDEIDLLKPARINSAGYRIYGLREIDQLQQILFYRSLDLKLEEIKKILTDPSFDSEQALRSHYHQLIERRNQMNHLIHTVEKTLSYRKGEITMTDKEKFEGFKKDALEQNEAVYGKEIRKKYGDHEVEKSNKKWSSLTVSQFNAMETTEKELFTALTSVFESKDIASLEAQQVFRKHKEWLEFTAPNYSAEYHIHLGKMYCSDKRFTAYYDSRIGAGATEILAAIIKKYAHTS